MNGLLILLLRVEASPGLKAELSVSLEKYFFSFSLLSSFEPGRETQD
jgi:hypothetical protein